MDSLHAEDTMDLASSPYRPLDDIDLELDQDDDFFSNPHPDSMFDDPPVADDIDTEEDAGQHLMAEIRDDDMIDEEPALAENDTVTKNPHSETKHDPEVAESHLDEEDILYEDDEDEDSINDTADIDSAQSDGQDDIRAQPDLQHATENDEGEQILDSGEKDFLPSQKGNTLDSENIDQLDHRPNENANADAKIQDYGHLNEDQDISQSLNAPQLQETHDEKADKPDGNNPGPERLQQSGTVSHEDEYIHPVKVNYQESEICLFPPTADDSSDTFFLPDTSVAHETLDRLLSACREVLADSIDEHDELVLDIASLGLHICEDSKYASQITLMQVLDVYLSLSHNETVDKVEPLYCSLTSRVSLASQLAYIQSAAQEGRTFSDISAEHVHSPDESTDGYDTNTHERSLYKGEATQAVAENHADEGNEPVEDGEGEEIKIQHHDFENTNSEFSKPHTELLDDVDQNTGSEQEPVDQTSAKKVPASDIRDFAISLPENSVAEHDNDSAFSDPQNTRDDDGTPETEAIPPATPVSEIEQQAPPSLQTDAEQEDEQESTNLLESNNDLYQSRSPLDDPELIEDESLAHGDKNDLKTVLRLESDSDDELDLIGDDLFEKDENGGIVEESHSTTQKLHDTPQDDTTDDLRDESAVEGGRVNGNHTSTSPIKAPVTPSKSKITKRKLRSDDQELELLDLDTPDSKRRRPS